MAETLNIHEARIRLSSLVDRAHAGEEILIARRGHPLARLVPIREDVDEALARFAELRARYTGPQLTTADLEAAREDGRP